MSERKPEFLVGFVELRRSEATETDLDVYGALLRGSFFILQLYSNESPGIILKM